MDNIQIKSVSDFKQEVKKLIRASKFSDARQLVQYHQKALEKSEMPLTDEERVTLCHWVTRVAIDSSQLALLSKDVITQVNTLIN